MLRIYNRNAIKYNSPVSHTAQYIQCKNKDDFRVVIERFLIYLKTGSIPGFLSGHNVNLSFFFILDVAA